MNNKKLIFIVTSLLLVCAVYLSWAEVKQADLNANKNWWTLAFADPKSSGMSFVIENHGNQNDFHYTILTADKTKLKEGDVTIQNGGSVKIDFSGQNLGDTEKIIVDVIAGKEKKEIHKNLAN